MTFLIIFLLLIATLFAASFVTKRRFGVLGLALAAGAFMSSLWVGDLTPIIAGAGIVTVEPPLESVVAAALILLPAALLLVSGPTYTFKGQRLLGALLFALLAGMLLLEPLGSALVIEGVGVTVYQFLQTHRMMIVTICLAFALIDIFATKTLKKPSKH